MVILGTFLAHGRAMETVASSFVRDFPASQLTKRRMGSSWHGNLFRKCPSSTFWLALWSLKEKGFTDMYSITHSFYPPAIKRGNGNPWNIFTHGDDPWEIIKLNAGFSSLPRLMTPWRGYILQLLQHRMGPPVMWTLVYKPLWSPWTSSLYLP